MNLNWILDGTEDTLTTLRTDHPALGVGEELLSYSQLAERRDHYVRLLVDEYDVVPGDRVALLLYNSTDYIALFFALARIGAIAVRLNFRLAPDELQYALEDSGSRLVCFSPDLAPGLDAVRSMVPVENYLLVGSTQDLPPWARALPEVAGKPVGMTGLDQPDPNDPVTIMYTSGTTGRPKGAIWTHANALWCAAIQAMKWSYTGSTVAMTAGPLYHAGAFEDLLLPALLSRGTAISAPSRAFRIENALTILRRHDVTDTLLYPFMIYDLLQQPDVNAGSLPNLRRVVTGGDPMMPWAVERFQELFPDTELVQAYGLTEGGTMATVLDAADCATHPDSVGQPMPLTSVRVVDPGGATAAPGQVGEVLVRSPSVSPEYWRRPEESAATFAGGWCRTGDLGRVTDDGFLVLVGRQKDMIRSGGENIYAAEVEAVLTSHPDVREVALIGVPDPKYLEVGCAVIVVDNGSTVSDDELLGFWRQKMAGYKCPKYVVRVAALPRNTSGKVLKALLRERYDGLGDLRGSGTDR